jgi:hypothetical protein
MEAAIDVALVTACCSAAFIAASLLLMAASETFLTQNM